MRNALKFSLLGFLVSMRSMTLPAVVSDYLATQPVWRQGNRGNGLLTDTRVAALTKAMAGGEILLDKLPIVPNRTNLLPLAGRIGVAGTLAVMLAKPDERVTSAVAAALAAAVGTYVMHELRTQATDRLNGNDLPSAITEDALVVGGSLLWRDAYLER
jgi:uncharacterized membrane protein